MAQFTIDAAPRSTNTLQFPANGVLIPANAHEVSIALTMPIDAERASTSARADFGVELLVSPSTTWKNYLMAGWTGGSGFPGKNSTVLNPAPVAMIGGDFFGAYAGERARLSLKLSEPMTVGAVITVS